MFFALFLTAAVKAQNPSVSFVVDSETIREDQVTYQIAVYINNPNSNATSVDINVQPGGTASNGTNFTYSPVTITFPANSLLEQFVTITVIDDSIPDGNKFVTFVLANPTNGATIGSIGTCELTMTDVDTPVIAVSPSTISQNESVATATFPLSLNRGVRGNTTVHANLIAPGTTAVPGVDFVFNNTAIVWPADSDGVQNISVGVIYNQFYEHDRTVEIKLTADNGAVLSDSVLKLTILANPGFSQPGCSDLFFGQYVDGTGNNQALQIYNPTAVPIDLSVYSILKSVNGGASTSVFNLTDTIAPYGVYIASNTGAVSGITNIADTVSSFFSFSGTDAFALIHSGDTVDIIGQLHTYPGASGWSVTGGTTVQHTLIRNYYDHAGDTSWSAASSTWNAFAVDMIDSLSFHHAEACSGGSPVATVRFLRSSDTIEQVDTFVNWIVTEVNNPTGDTVFYVMAFDPNKSTAVDGLDENGINDFHYSNRGYFAPPGLSYDTVLYFDIFTNAIISPPKSVYFVLINLSPNLVAIPDSTYTLYLANHNKFIVSFLGAGYSYPKGSGLVKIPVVTSTFSSQPTTVDVSLSIGSAVLGQDFLFSDTTITFPAFSTDTQGVFVTILNNNVYEANRQANFNLSNATNGGILGITGFTLTIINNDSLAGGIINNGREDGLKLFPNPVSNNLFIATDKKLLTVEITDMTGNKITDLGMFSAGTTSVNISPLSAGVYFLHVKTNEGILSKRFVKTE